MYPFHIHFTISFNLAHSINLFLFFKYFFINSINDIHRICGLLTNIESIPWKSIGWTILYRVYVSFCQIVDCFYAPLLLFVHLCLRLSLSIGYKLTSSSPRLRLFSHTIIIVLSCWSETCPFYNLLNFVADDLLLTVCYLCGLHFVSPYWQSKTFLNACRNTLLKMV